MNSATPHLKHAQHTPISQGAVSFACIALLLGAMVFVGTPEASATPFYSASAAHACNTCHVEPSGWANPPERRDRRCTLDCSGCHVTPTGGGLRTPMGRYYGEEVLPMFGRGPGDDVDTSAYLDEGYPDEGSYRLFSGFEGWWPGELSHRDLDNRTGRINPEPVWQIGGDARSMIYTVLGEDGETSVFPMQFDVDVAVHPMSNLTAYMSVGLQGDRDLDYGADADALDYFTIREAYVMLHDLPMGGYVRAGHMQLPYGWRLPDHTAFTRRGAFDQYRHVFGAEIGVGANYGWANLAVWGQGADWWPGDRLSQGHGITAQGGFRKLGYTLGGSLHFMSGEGGREEFMAGPLWSLNLYPVIWLGELAYRQDQIDGELTHAAHALHEIQFLGLKGLTPRLRYEWTDPNMDIIDNHSHRIEAGVEWNVYKYIQLNIAYRNDINVGRANSSALLAMIHFWLN